MFSIVWGKARRQNVSIVDMCLLATKYTFYFTTHALGCECLYFTVTLALQPNIGFAVCKPKASVKNQTFNPSSLLGFSLGLDSRCFSCKELLIKCWRRFLWWVFLQNTFPSMVLLFRWKLTSMLFGWIRFSVFWNKFVGICFFLFSTLLLSFRIYWFVLLFSCSSLSACLTHVLQLVWMITLNSVLFVWL